MDDLAGKSFGPYRVLEKVGEGGMAVVYKAYQESLGRYAAIKVLRAELARDEEFVARFRREALAVAQFNHSNILQVYDAGVANGVYYMAMGFIDGGSLKDLIAQGPMDTEYAVSIVAQMADALGYAHKQGIIHRDVKPSNVLMSRDGRPMLTDFGIAKAMYESASLTRTGISIGTPEYMAPEQIQGQTVDGRTDIYSLGIVLYEMLTGWAPFSTPTPVATLYKQVNEAPPPVHQVNVNVPEWLEGVVGKALAKRPEARYQQASEFAEALRSRGRSGAVPLAPAAMAAAGAAAPAQAAKGQPRGAGKTGEAKRASPAQTPAPASKASPGPLYSAEHSAAAQAERAATAPAVPAAATGAAPGKKKGMVPILVGAIALLVVTLIGGAIYLAWGGKDNGKNPAVVTMVVTSAQQGAVASVPTDGGGIAMPVASDTPASPSATPEAGVAVVEASPVPAATSTPTSPPAATNTPSPTATSVPPTNTPKPTAVPTKKPVATKNTCPAWYQKPQPGKGVLLIENHIGQDVNVEQIVGGSGKWSVPAKQGDVPGRLLLQLAPGYYEFRDSLASGGGGYIKLKIEAGKSFVSPIWFNDRSEELVYPLDPPAGCK